MRNPPGSLLPDFRARGVIVGRRVIGIAELVQNLALALGLHSNGQIPGAFHALLTGNVHHLGAVCTHGGPALLTQVIRHDQHHSVALDGRGHGQRDTGIAGGGFNQGVPGLDLAPAFSLLDHAQSRPVFHRTCRVVPLQFCQDDVTGVSRQTLQTHQGCMADIIFNGGENHIETL